MKLIQVYLFNEQHELHPSTLKTLQVFKGMGVETRLYTRKEQGLYETFLAFDPMGAAWRDALCRGDHTSDGAILVLSTSVECTSAFVVGLLKALAGGLVLGDGAGEPPTPREKWGSVVAVGPTGQGLSTKAQTTSGRKSAPIDIISEYRRRFIPPEIVSPADVLDNNCVMMVAGAFRGEKDRTVSNWQSSLTGKQKIGVAEAVFTRNSLPSPPVFTHRKTPRKDEVNILIDVTDELIYQDYLACSVHSALRVSSSVTLMVSDEIMIQMIHESDYVGTVSIITVDGGSPRERLEKAKQLLPQDEWLLVMKHDEYIESSFTRESMLRLLQHPSAIVRAYDVSILSAWEGPDLIREDPPWRTSEVRLFVNTREPSLSQEPSGFHHGYAPPHSSDARRVANLRLIGCAAQTPAGRLRKRNFLRRRDPDSPTSQTGSPGYSHLVGDDGAVLSRLPSSTRIGLHMLAYEAEELSDIERWFDELHGVVSDISVCWTSPHKPTESISWLCDKYGASLVHSPLNDDIASARNVAMSQLNEENRWNLFFDPDEWLADHIANAQRLRDMAGSSSAHGYLFQVLNFTSGEPNVSESIRMSRSPLRMKGRVHESFSSDLMAARQVGVQLDIRSSGFMLHHRGMNQSPEERENKLAKYERLLVLELQDNPDNAQAWMALAAHVRDAGDIQRALGYLERADSIAGSDSYVIRRELSAWHLAAAYSYQVTSVSAVNRTHPYHQVGLDQAKAIRSLLPKEYPHVGRIAPLTSQPENPEG